MEKEIKGRFRNDKNQDLPPIFEETHDCRSKRSRKQSATETPSKTDKNITRRTRNIIIEKCSKQQNNQKKSKHALHQMLFYH